MIYEMIISYKKWWYDILQKKCVRDDGMIHHVWNDDMIYEMMMIYMKWYICIYGNMCLKRQCDISTPKMMKMQSWHDKCQKGVRWTLKRIKICVK